MHNEHFNFSFPNDGAAVTPSDIADLAKPGLLYIGVAGNVKVTTVAGTDLTFVGVPAGFFLPVRAKKVFSTGTTATSILCLYAKN